MTFSESILPRGWRVAALAEFATEAPNSFVDGPFGSELKVSDLSKEGFPLIRIQHIGEAHFLEGFDQFVSEKKFRELSKHDVIPGDLVFAKLGDPVGRSAMIPNSVERGLIVADCVRLRIDSKKIEPQYLRWAVNSPTVLNQISVASKGATRQRANLSDFKTLRIPIPASREEQQRIAGRLERADRLRRTRRYALELGETFLSAAFLELFNDLRTNPRGYELRDLGDICDVRDGTHDSPKFHRQGIPLVTSKNLVNGSVDLSNVSFISEEDYEKINKRSKVHQGDILMPMIGTIGNPVLVEEPPRFAIKNVALIKAVAGSPSLIYIRELLRGRYFEHLTSMNSRGGTQQFIALSDIRGFCIPVPPISLQQKFAALAERVEGLRTVQREALRQVEHLFASLLHQAFSV